MNTAHTGVGGRVALAVQKYTDADRGHRQNTAFEARNAEKQNDTLMAHTHNTADIIKAAWLAGCVRQQLFQASAARTQARNVLSVARNVSSEATAIASKQRDAVPPLKRPQRGSRNNSRQQPREAAFRRSVVGATCQRPALPPPRRTAPGRCIFWVLCLFPDSLEPLGCV